MPLRYTPASKEASAIELERAFKVLSTLEDLHAKHELSIIKLSEPITQAVAAADDDSQKSQKNLQHSKNHSASDTSAADNEQQKPTPLSLEADLAHYRELFKKLRFSYVEQVTKEKFIRAIVGDPPLIVLARDNAALAAKNGLAKTRLNDLKAEVVAAVGRLGRKGGELAQRARRVEKEEAALRQMPRRIGELERELKELRERLEVGEGEAEGMKLPLAKTERLVNEKRTRMAELDRQLAMLRGQVSRKRKEMERLQAELAPLEVKRQNSVAMAREAKRRKEAALGGVEDDLEKRGRWWRASETALRDMLDMKR